MDCPKCKVRLKIIYKDILDPAKDIFKCPKCGIKTLRYDNQKGGK